jgi:DNA polymerase
VNQQDAYNALVSKRKKCRICSESGLTNPACVEGGIYDSDHIGPWSCWQGDLDAEIMVVGQDWGGLKFFEAWKGIDPPFGNPTNSNLSVLLHQFGISIKPPQEPQDQKIFLTNMILCLKGGDLQAPIKDEWLTNCSGNFFSLLVEIVKPKIILALGKRVSETILDLYGISYSKSAPLSLLMNGSPFKLTESTSLFPVYHCGAGGVNRNRPMEMQEEDWRKAAEWFRASTLAENA